MRKLFITILSAFVSLAIAQQPAIKTTQDMFPHSKARILFDSEVFEFGFSPQGSEYLVHAYKVINVGEDTLNIIRVRPTCGCTAAPLKKKKLAPGESTELIAIFKLSGYRRTITKSIKVESDDPMRKIVSLRFSANLDTAVWHDISKGPRIFSAPEMIDLGKGNLFQSSYNVAIKNASNQNLTLEIIDYTKDIITEPRIKNANLKPGKFSDVEFNVLVHYDTEKLIKASITIVGMDENGDEMCRITVPIIGAGK